MTPTEVTEIRSRQTHTRTDLETPASETETQNQPDTNSAISLEKVRQIIESARLNPEAIASILASVANLQQTTTLKIEAVNAEANLKISEVNAVAIAKISEINSDEASQLATFEEQLAVLGYQKPIQRRGHPLDSKATAASLTTKRRGRPPGSKNRPK